MKNTIVNCSQRHSQWHRRLICIMAAVLCFIPAVYGQTADAILGRGRPTIPDVKLKPLGGDGGNPFYARCPQGQLLTGVQLWAGDDVDAIRPVCEDPPGSPDTGQPSSSTRYGGDGGSSVYLFCPRNAPIVIGLDIRWEGREIESVNNIGLFCGMAATTQTPSEIPNAAFNGPPVTATTTSPFIIFHNGKDKESCPTGLVAVGIHGRSGKLLDAVGLICGSPTLTPRAGPPAEVPPVPAVKAIGRRRTGAPTDPPALTGPPTPICDAAQQARARNNPAAPGLEEKCLNDLAARGAAITDADPAIAEACDLQPVGPARRGFYIGIAASEGQTAPGSGKDRIRDSLPPAEQGGFAAAVTFALLRNRKKIADDLAATGEAIANRDPLAAQLRRQQRESSARKGFDIGMAAAQGKTENGPEIQIIRNTLSPDEQRGFDAAVSFSFARNKEKVGDPESNLAARGREIANKDPLALELRRQQPGVDARRGFDIGMAAAEGQTAPGSGKDRIRDSLPPPEQGGFTAAVVFSLERNRQAGFASVGAMIAEKDRIVAVLRNSERNVFFRLGFDIASGIFGDPALGAKGNTAKGSGSMKIRDSLSADAQRGFDASVALHLSRKY